MSWLGTCRAITCPFLEHAELSHVLAWNMQSYHMSFLGTCRAITCPGLEHAELSHVLAWNMQFNHWLLDGLYTQCLVMILTSYHIIIIAKYQIIHHQCLLKKRLNIMKRKLKQWSTILPILIYKTNNHLSPSTI